MAYEFLGSISASTTLGDHDVTTGALDTTGADLIVLVVAHAENSGASGITVSDSEGNTWLVASDGSQAGTSRALAIYYVQSPDVSGTHTFTCETGNDVPSIFVAAFSGSKESPLDQENSTDFTETLEIQAGSITPTENNELIIAAHLLNADRISSLAIDQSFSIEEALPFVTSPATAKGGGLAYLIQTSAAAVNPTWSWSGAAQSRAAIVSFKAEASSNKAAHQLLWSTVIDGNKLRR